LDFNPIICDIGKATANQASKQEQKQVNDQLARAQREEASSSVLFAAQQHQLLLLSYRNSIHIGIIFQGNLPKLPTFAEKLSFHEFSRSQFVMEND